LVIAKPGYSQNFDFTRKRQRQLRAAPAERTPARASIDTTHCDG
jgi:hypothetical protein